MFCGMFGDVGCSGCSALDKGCSGSGSGCLVAGCLECGILRVWDVGDVRCWGCAMSGICHVGDMGSWGCGMWVMWDARDM